MDFSYIKKTATCLPKCAKSIGPSSQGDPGIPTIPGNPGTPSIPGEPDVPGNPSVVGDGPIIGGTTGQEINCVKVELIPTEATIKVGQLLPFIIKVTYSNGSIGYPVQNSVWSSSNDAIAVFDNATEAFYRTGRDPDDPLLDEGILNDPLNIDWGFYIRGVSPGEVQVTAQYDAPSTKDPLIENQSSNWYGACSATLIGTVTVEGECFNSIESDYVWGIPADEDPATVLSAGEISCHMALFEIEQENLRAQYPDNLLVFGEPTWVNSGTTGTLFNRKSMAYKAGASVCDPNNSTGDTIGGFSNYSTLTATYCIQDKPVPQSDSDQLPDNGESLSLGLPDDDAMLMVMGNEPIQLQPRLQLTNGKAVLLRAQAVHFSSSNKSVAVVNQHGFISARNAGLATIKSRIGQFSAEVQVEVVQPPSVATLHGNTWTARPIDAVIVIDRSASMLLKDEFGVTREERARKAALTFLSQSDQEDSQIALVSFAGTWISGTPPLTEADATVDLALTTDKREIRAALNEFGVRGPCMFMEGEGTRCGTGIGSGLEAAQAEINSDRHDFGNKKMIVLLSDGCENINKPAPGALAQEIKDEGTLIAVVGLDVNAACAATLEAIASPGLYFSSPTVYELSFQFARITHVVQYAEYGYPWLPDY